MDKLCINSCGISDCLPDWSWTTGEGGFPDFDLWCVFRGRGGISVAGETYDVSAGSCFLLPPETAITAWHDRNDPLLVINVHFDPMDRTPFLRSSAPRHRRMRDPAFFRELLDRMLFSYYRNDAGRAEIWLSAATAEFFASDDSVPRAAERRGRSVVYKICDDIVASSLYNARLSDLAKKYGYSPTYLGKLFHVTIGMEYEKYLINARINEAKTLLRSSDFPIARVSDMLGYCDVCFFIKQFTKYVGVTPGKYRYTVTV